MAANMYTKRDDEIATCDEVTFSGDKNQQLDIIHQSL